MKIVLQIALGIIAATGGFVDIGDLVFDARAGALFGYQRPALPGRVQLTELPITP